MYVNNNKRTRTTRTTTNAAPRWEFKNTDFVDKTIYNILRDLHFELGQPLKSANDRHIGISKKIVKSKEYLGFFLFQLVSISPVTGPEFWARKL